MVHDRIGDRLAQGLHRVLRDVLALERLDPVGPVGVRASGGDHAAVRVGRVDLDALERTLQINRARGGTAAVLIEPIGRFTIADTGYQRIELWSAEGLPAPALEVEALVLDGPAAAQSSSSPGHGTPSG